MKRKDSHIPETGNKQMDSFGWPGTPLRQTQHGTLDTNRSLLAQITLSGFQQAVAQLHEIFEVLPNELVGCPGGLPTSFVRVERTLARCIAGCLPDVPEQNKGIDYLQSLLHAYKVVRLVRGYRKSPTVSLERVHSLLKDNYLDSCFCVFFDIMLSGYMGVRTKVITFY